MYKLTLLTLGLFIMLPTSLFAYDLGVRAYYPTTKLSYECLKLSISLTGKPTCTSYNPVTKAYTARTSNIVLQKWSHLYDSQDVKIYESDKISTPNKPDSVVKYGNIKLPTGEVVWTFYTMTADNQAGLLVDLLDKPKTERSMVIK